MPIHGATLMDFDLARPADEDAFLAWWDQACALLAERFRLAQADLDVMGRGRYAARLQFPLPGTWKLVTQDARWTALLEQRPEASVRERPAVPFHTHGNPRHVTTSTLARWLDERAAGRRDLVVVDTLSPASYARSHLPGAVNLMVQDTDEAHAVAVLGADRARGVVTYCSGYT